MQSLVPSNGIIILVITVLLCIKPLLQSQIYLKYQYKILNCYSIKPCYYWVSYTHITQFTESRVCSIHIQIKETRHHCLLLENTSSVKLVHLD